MIDVYLQNDNVVFEVIGWHKIWTFKSKIIISKKDIVKAYQDKKPFGFWKGWRMPGTEIPGIIIAGSYYQRSEWYFWDVINKKKTIIVELKNAEYKKLIIEVANPLETMHFLNQL